jgi:hypothetical protein
MTADANRLEIQQPPCLQKFTPECNFVDTIVAALNSQQ